MLELKDITAGRTEFVFRLIPHPIEEHHDSYSLSGLSERVRNLYTPAWFTSMGFNTIPLELHQDESQ